MEAFKLRFNGCTAPFECGSVERESRAPMGDAVTRFRVQPSPLCHTDGCSVPERAEGAGEGDTQTIQMNVNENVWEEQMSGHAAALG